MIPTLICAFLIRSSDGLTLGPARVNFDCECGISNPEVSPRIIGGTFAVSHTYPWMASIIRDESSFCGGSLINDRYVLTAGHCIPRPSEKRLTVALGAHDLRKYQETTVIDVEKIILHKDFDSDDLHDINDLALLKLSRPVKFGNKVKSICLPSKGVGYEGKEATVTGWGRTVRDVSGNSTFLKQATLKILSLQECRDSPLGSHVTSSMLCAFKNNTDTCQGDSGGPLALKREDQRYELIGVTSWGLECASEIPGVYVKLVDYLNWVYYNTQDATYCKDKDN
ncbi:trypsin-1 [Orussus abietinus]|uniref:trypsin-1 n=1 Tax=Orussus abietinus TaxID=222816 RepID=UPI0006251722|nr:trypsin-1 [Orussus abietinus]XP_012288931.1 trypsin-1 [Orussus abietinus]